MSRITFIEFTDMVALEYQGAAKKTSRGMSSLKDYDRHVNGSRLLTANSLFR
jgi:hypothetical protein